MNQIASAIAAIEAESAVYEIGNLQALRKQLRGLQRAGATRIFGWRSTKDDYAFHSGGRDELQFNVGLDRYDDGTPAFRAGVGFSFETSRSLPSIEVLLLKVAPFNEYLREGPEEFDGLSMWHWRNEHRSSR